MNELTINNNLIGSILSLNSMLYRYTSSPFVRNSGAFTEPCVYQIVLLLALFLLMFTDIEYKKKQNKTLFIIINIVTVVSTLSTTAYICLGIFLSIYIISYKMHIAKKITFLAVIVLVIYIFSFIPAIRFTFIDKLNFDSETMTFSDGSGTTRLDDILTDIEIFKKNIWGIGYHEYFKLFDTYRNISSISRSGASSSGLTIFLAVYGIIISIIYFGSCFYNIISGCRNWAQIAAVLSFFILMFFTQNAIMFSITLLFFVDHRNLYVMEKMLTSEVIYEN